MKIVLLITVIIAAIIFGPIITIWSLNTLFGLSIPTTFYTWAATLWLCGLFSVGSKSHSK